VNTPQHLEVEEIKRMMLRKLLGEPISRTKDLLTNTSEGPGFKGKSDCEFKQQRSQTLTFWKPHAFDKFSDHMGLIESEVNEI